MIVHDINKRVILWGFRKNEVEVLGQIAYIASHVFYPFVELENGITIEIPPEYLGKTYSTALVNFKTNIIKKKET